MSLFTDLDLLEEGDQFYLYILDEILAYEVDQIETVMPEDTEILNVEEGKDYVTLVTCTPYGVNTQRLLVRGHRVPYVEEQEKEQERQAKKKHSYELSGMDFYWNNSCYRLHCNMQKYHLDDKEKKAAMEQKGESTGIK